MSRIDYVGLARQPAGKGTKVTTMEYFVPVETANVATTRETLEIEETTGTRFPIGIDYGTRYFEIPLVGAPRVASLPRVLSGFLGQPVASGAGPYTHTFDPTLAGKIAEWHSILAVRKDPVPPIVDLFWDCRGNEFQLNIAPNDYLRFEATYLALHLDDTAVEPGTHAPDLSSRKKFSQATVELSIDGGTVWSPRVSAGWGMTYNNNLDTDEAILGSRELYALPEGNVDLEVRWSPREGINDAYRAYLEEDPSELAVRMTATDADGTVVMVRADSVEITETEAPISGADVLKMVEVTARGRLATAPANKILTIAVTNNVVSYP